jgi:uncharacterized protein
VKTHFEIKKTSNGKFMFNLKAPNDEVILTSQMYESKQSAEEGIRSVQENSEVDERFEHKSGHNGKPYFVLHAANQLVIGTSEMYSARDSMLKGIASVKRNAPIAETVDLTVPTHA